MGFWRKDVVEFALDEQTGRAIDEQLRWIAAEPSNPAPYANLARLYRSQGHQDRALALLLESVRIDPGHAPAHQALCEIYAVRGDYPAAWRHARLAEKGGNPAGVLMLNRHAIAEPGGHSEVGEPRPEC